MDSIVVYNYSFQIYLFWIVYQSDKERERVKEKAVIQVTISLSPIPCKKNQIQM